ncbi:hypothetical protein [Roseivirga misakiensis]|uniref:Uncharacterized protein n=1 Tax=Roseivirga misakiensis TaxID=1563681 RepID=A0A1E5SKR8_9BACT|nr:hypothetical protein [Roseivirga misakiensis]OEJ99719.1 hypothetical protein BFP71_09120 [Roseivirga misakiensis]
MKNTEAYFTWHYIVLTLIILILINALWIGDFAWLFATIPFLISIGIIQLITAIDYSLKDLPSRFSHDWRSYWIMNVVYFSVMIIIFRASEDKDLLQIWLLVIPWLIAGYQFALVKRIYKWRVSNADTPNIDQL